MLCNAERLRDGLPCMNTRTRIDTTHSHPAVPLVRSVCVYLCYQSFGLSPALPVSLPPPSSPPFSLASSFSASDALFFTTSLTCLTYLQGKGRKGRKGRDRERRERRERDGA